MTEIPDLLKLAELLPSYTGDAAMMIGDPTTRHINERHRAVVAPLHAQIQDLKTLLVEVETSLRWATTNIDPSKNMPAFMATSKLLGRVQKITTASAQPKEPRKMVDPVDAQT